MQGRLSPPEDGRIQAFPSQSWRDEFALASNAGIDAIEWIYEDYRAAENPLAFDDGISEIQHLSRTSGVGVHSVCADFLMDQPLFRSNDATVGRSIERFFWLIERTSAVGASRIVIPFVAANEMKSADDMQVAIDVTKRWSAAARLVGVTLHVETSLAPLPQREFLEAVNEPNVRVTYDTGNSVLFNHDMVEEIGAYGPKIGSVHIKDAIHGMTTVRLGTGQARIGACLAALREIGYDGPYVLQGARVAGEPETTTVRQYAAIVREILCQLDTGGPPAS